MNKRLQISASAALQQVVIFALLTLLVTLPAQPAMAQTPANNYPLRIGADQSGGNLFRGRVAAVRLYDRALTGDEVATLSKAKPDSAAPSARPIREWILGKLTNQHVADSIRQSMVTPSGAVTSDTIAGIASARFVGGFMEAKDDKSLKFDGDFTLEAWMRPPGGTMNCRILDKITPGGGDGFLLDFVNNSLRFINGSKSTSRAWDSSVPAWTHICVVSASNKVVLYINGKTETEAGAAKPQITFEGSAAPPESPLTLWWKTPGTAWNQAMMMGNGRIGAMVAGGVQQENIWLNEDTLWSGENTTSHSTTAFPAFQKIKQLLLDRKEPAANNAYSAMFGPYKESYLPLGNLNLLFPITGVIEDYQRTLDLPTGVATVKYRQAGVTYKREIFLSYPDQAVIMRLSANQPGKISFSAYLSSLLRYDITGAGAVLRMTGRCPAHADPSYIGGAAYYDEGPNPKGMRFAADLQAQSNGGKVAVEDGQIVAENCNTVTLVLVAATSYNGFDKSPSREGKDPVALCAAQLAKTGAMTYESLRSRHVRDFSALMNRVSLALPQTPDAKRPIDERVGSGFKDDDLPALTTLLYQFGRYLLVSSSRPGSQPDNLQGMWDDSIAPAWSCNYTMNCNAEINYLGVEAANLSELHEPFIRMVQEWSVDGARVAKDWYGCRGWVGHHNIDLWRAASPVSGSPSFAAFVCGGAWGCQHLWEHYAFTLDQNYLRSVWPTLRGCAQFFLDLLVKDPKTGYLVTSADTNFENEYRRPDGSVTSLCLSPTPSNMIVRQLFLNCIAATKVLNCDATMRQQMENAVSQLPPTVVSPRDGKIQEYLDPDYTIAHREYGEFLSMWGLVWSNQISPRKTPELAAAIRKSYEAPDLRPWITGDIGSWRGTFVSNSFARLGDGSRMAEILTTYFRHVPLPNLGASFGGPSCFEIDGNFGLMSAIGEMLLQSQNGEIEFLPALPPAWSSGSVTGLRARGGFTVDIEWHDGHLTRAVVRAGGSNGTCQLRYGTQTRQLNLKAGMAETWTPHPSPN